MEELIMNAESWNTSSIRKEFLSRIKKIIIEDKLYNKWTLQLFTINKAN
jgi:hypothetical protein